MAARVTLHLRPVGDSMPRLLAALTVIVVAGTVSTHAQDVTGFLELLWDRTERQSEREDAPTTSLELATLRQRYRLDFRWQLYPNLSFSLGGLFERDDTSDLGITSLGESTRQRWSPYISVRQRSRLFFADLDVIRLQDTSQAFGQSAEETQDNYSAVFGWRPEPYPRVSFRFQRTDNYDSTRSVRDLTRDLAEFRIQWETLDSLRLNYRAGQDVSTNRVEGNEIRRRYQTGNLSYGDSFWDRRVQLSADYNFDQQDSVVTTTGSGEISTPVVPLEGLSALNDFPENVTLVPNPALIDENLVASAGINLGLPPPGGDDRLRNIGLDLGEPTAVNTLRVWVDTDLPLTISNSYEWDIYTSSDNIEWSYRQTVAPAPFGTFELRFEIRFPSLTARYVKVVTRPLDASVPDASQFSDIFVTEMEAFLRTPASEIDSEFGNTVQRFTTDLRTRLLRDNNLFYEFSYSARDTQGRPLVWSMSNGLSYNERLNPALTFSARAARVDEADLDVQLTSYLYGASLRAEAVPTISHTVVFSGRWNDLPTGSDYTNSVFLYNGLKIYRGATANIGLGTAGSKRPDGLTVLSYQVNATVNLVPHRTFSMNLQHQQTKEERSGGTLTEDARFDRGISTLSAAYTPLPAIYLFGSYRIEQRSDAPDLTTRNYSLSWNPLAGGSLQLTFQYNETFRDELNTLFRFFTTRARWNITRRWYVEVAWEDSMTESDLVTSDVDILRAGTRLVF
jgi:hypothetical protein